MMKASIAVLETKFADLHESLNEHKFSSEKHHEELKGLLLQQNGRVNKLEQWRNFIMGGLGLAAFIFTVYGIKIFGG